MLAGRATIGLKRVYDAPSKEDGTRVLVDRLWPRGLTKRDASIDTWLRDLAPSNELRKWIHSHPEQWPEFRKRYRRELEAEAARDALYQLAEIRKSKTHVTLVFASKNLETNNATALKGLIESKSIPPKKAAKPRPAAQGRTRTSKK